MLDIHVNQISRAKGEISKLRYVKIKNVDYLNKFLEASEINKKVPLLRVKLISSYLKFKACLIRLDSSSAVRWRMPLED